MPLVVPGINSTSGDNAEEWQNKLVGKKLSDEETSTETVFAKRDLPQETRIIEPGMMVTKDFKENRLNVHLKDDGTVSHVVKG
ncbi:putative pua rna binding domain-containing protein [Fusarium austroafricanum]|uniref:Putative pua rna binding domain-containing protein n=1 Tax=Fusarium austroafricanum TaxID=2364996 RepID=A0A8H4NHZ6_9HYPO|nr:putative pua rna binding domain-containing protein [Fusarium austroafricanum]